MALPGHGLGTSFCACAEAPLGPGYRRFLSSREALWDISGTCVDFWLSNDSLLRESMGITNYASRIDQLAV